MKIGKKFQECSVYNPYMSLCLSLHCVGLKGFSISSSSGCTFRSESSSNGDIQMLRTVLRLCGGGAATPVSHTVGGTQRKSLKGFTFKLNGKKYQYLDFRHQTGLGNRTVGIQKSHTLIGYCLHPSTLLAPQEWGRPAGPASPSLENSWTSPFRRRNVFHSEYIQSRTTQIKCSLCSVCQLVVPFTRLPRPQTRGSCLASFPSLLASELLRPLNLLFNVSHLYLPLQLQHLCPNSGYFNFCQV